MNSGIGYRNLWTCHTRSIYYSGFFFKILRIVKYTPSLSTTFFSSLYGVQTYFMIDSFVRQVLRAQDKQYMYLHIYILLKAQTK
jgi:hypothetical protein